MYANDTTGGWKFAAIAGVFSDTLRKALVFTYHIDKHYYSDKQGRFAYYAHHCCLIFFHGTPSLMKSPLSTFFAVAVSGIALPFLFLHAPFSHPALLFGAVFIVSSGFYIAMALLLPRITISGSGLLATLAIAFVLRLSFVGMDPIGSEDAYRYVWDGKVQANGLNPYLYPATDPHLAFLRSPLLPAAMNHADLRTIYFPLSEWIFYGCYVVSGESLWSYKLVYLAAEALTIFGLFLLLRGAKIDRKFLLLYALCPLPIIEFALDAHLDAIGLPLLIFALFFYRTDRPILSYFVLALSISIKPVGLILLPGLFLLKRGWRNKIAACVVPPVVLVAQFIPYLFSSNPFQTLSTFTRNWSFNGPIFEPLYAMLNNNQTARLFCAVLLLVALLLLLWRRRELIDTVYFSFVALILFSPVVHPWYVAWIALLLPLTRRWSGIALAAGVSLTSFTVVTYRMTGTWIQYPLAMVGEFGPVLVLIVLELRGYFARSAESLAA